MIGKLILKTVRALKKKKFKLYFIQSEFKIFEVLKILLKKIYSHFFYFCSSTVLLFLSEYFSLFLKSHPLFYS